MTNKSKRIKPQAERIFAPDGFWLRAACVCVRDGDSSESEVLLVSSSGSPDSWIIPGGKIQRNEIPEDSALREAEEEAGVVGRLGRYLGSFDNTDRKHRTSVFVLKVTDILEDFEDKETRRRNWFPVDEALQLLLSYKPMHGKYLTALRQSHPGNNQLKKKMEEDDDEDEHRQNGGGGSSSSNTSSSSSMTSTTTTAAAAAAAASTATAAVKT